MCAMGGGLPLFDLAFDLGARARAVRPDPAKKIGVASLGIADRVRGNLGPVVSARLRDEVALGQVFEPLGEGLSAIECLADGHSVRRGKLKEDVRADREDRRAHRGRELFEVLICRNDRDAELARFRQHRLDACAGIGIVLHLVGVDREERTALACEERVL